MLTAVNRRAAPAAQSPTGVGHDVFVTGCRWGAQSMDYKVRVAAATPREWTPPIGHRSVSQPPGAAKPPPIPWRVGVAKLETGSAVLRRAGAEAWIVSMVNVDGLE